MRMWIAATLLVLALGGGILLLMKVITDFNEWQQDCIDSGGRVVMIDDGENATCVPGVTVEIDEDH